MNKTADYMIVGQGIAGTTLAYTLMKEGKSVLIIDDPSLSNASRVAAGLYNPVVFKRLTKSWMADELIPFMNDFYREAEELLNVKFFHQKQLIKLFAEENEKEFWLKKSKEDVGKYMSKTIYDHFLEGIVHAPLGASEVLHAGNVQTRVFLSAFRDYFKSKDCLLEEKLETSQLVISENSVTYKNIQAKKILFCEGFKAAANPYFDWLSFRLTKGEILTIRLSEKTVIPTGKVINKGVFILPLGNNTYRVGSTNEWDDLTENLTEKAKEELVSKLEKVLKVPYEIIAHEAGIRPAVNDRRPMLGLHPQHPALAVFNGMGTKGVMIAPYFAKRMADFLERNIPLDPEVDIFRFIQLSSAKK